MANSWIELPLQMISIASLPVTHVIVDSGNLTSIVDPVTVVNSGTFAVQASQSGSWTVTALQGTSPWVVSGSVTTSPDVNIHDSSGNPLNSTSGSLNVDVTNTVPISGTISATQGTSPWVVSGTVTANAGTGNFTVIQPTGTNLHVVLDSGTLTSITNPVTVVNSGTFAVQAAQSGSWTVTANAGTGNFTVVQPTGSNLHVDVDNFLTTQAVTQSTSPWVTNISQFGGSNVVTGTGSSGSGIPRVTVSNDSNILVTQSTSPWVVAGNVSNNATAPGATNLGVLPALANAAVPSWTEGDQVLLSVDLSGSMRATLKSAGPASGSGTVIAAIGYAAGVTLTYDLEFATGLTIVTVNAATDITVTYQ